MNRLAMRLACFAAFRFHDGNVRTHSLISVGGYAERSYFYRTHRTCAENDKTGIGLDGFVLDMITRAGD